MADSRDDKQATLFDWQGTGAGRLGDLTSRGTLDLSGVPDGMGDYRPAAHRLHVRLEQLLGTVDLVVTDNRRRMISSRGQNNRQQIRAHHMFLGCGDAIVEAIAELASGQNHAREPIKAFINRHRDTIRFEPTAAELDAKGDHFDLELILGRVVDMVECLTPEALEPIHITWGRRGRGTKSIRFGSFDFDRRLIRIHPALDRSWVPRYFVEFIVYHELLHAIFPPRQGQARRQIHPPEFRAVEKQFPHYDKATRWEAANLERVLGNS